MSPKQQLHPPSAAIAPSSPPPTTSNELSSTSTTVSSSTTHLDLPGPDEPAPTLISKKKKKKQCNQKCTVQTKKKIDNATAELLKQKGWEEGKWITKNMR